MVLKSKIKNGHSGITVFLDCENSVLELGAKQQDCAAHVWKWCVLLGRRKEVQNGRFSLRLRAGYFAFILTLTPASVVIPQ